jgi:hypothetical protein
MAGRMAVSIVAPSWTAQGRRLNRLRKDADPNLPEPADAKKRLVGLL